MPVGITNNGSHVRVLNGSQIRNQEVPIADEMVESIGTFLLQSKEKYQVEPLYVSVNEPTIGRAMFFVC